MAAPLPTPLLCLALLVLHSAGATAQSQTAQSQTADSATKLDYNRDIRPILSNHCFACHGPDGSNRQADLRLDQRQPAIDLQAITPGSLSKSKLISRIHSNDASEIMPPPETKKPLTTDQIQLLENWIEQGAEYQTHWAYTPPTRLPTPAPSAASAQLDYWVNTELANRGIEPSPQADRRTLIRRLYADLIGLPPTPERVEAFVLDSRPDAYRILVEELLNNPHYGERMAIGWLDLVRFADTIGYHSDNPRNIWPYRDYVIAAFNSNKPFDRFTIEQLAGDLLPDATQETKIASAFNRLILTTEEGGAQPKDYEARMLADRVRAIGTVWLGHTIGCAQCHDHKYDPFTMQDFYALGAFFADIQEGIVAPREEGIPVLNEDQTKELERLKQIAEQLKPEQTQDSDNDKRNAAKKEIEALLKSAPKCLVTKSSDKRRTVRVLPRGNWMDDSGPILQPAFPTVLQPVHLQSPQTNNQLPATSEQPTTLSRLDLANWLVSRENPLTARVVMNRLWKHFFGTGLSKVLDDLGAQGETPVNQPLLDTLACEFMDSDWDFKHMVRSIVLSETYQRSTLANQASLSKDPMNRYTGRQSPWRHEAELIRDQALSLAGLLSPRIGGPSAKPYQPDGYWENLNFPTRTYTADTGEQQYRRGLYTWWQRTFLHPSLLAFDAPSREECAAERTRSNIPQQALVLLNDPTYVEAARSFAVRAIETVPKSESSDAWIAQRIDWMMQQALQREPTKSEAELLSSLIEKQTQNVHQSISSRQHTTNTETGIETNNDPERDVWTHVARVLLNLHESITRN